MCGERCPECGSGSKCLYAESMRQVAVQSGRVIGGHSYKLEEITIEAGNENLQVILKRCIRPQELRRAMS